METAAIHNKGLVNGAHTMPHNLYDADEDEPKEMAQENKLSLPSWVLPVMITILIAFITNLGTSLYWAGQMASNQTHMVEQFNDLKAEVNRLRTDNQSLREEVIGLKAIRQQR